MPKIAETEYEMREEWDPTKISHRCWLCRTTQTIIVRFINGNPTKTRTGVCRNTDCPRYVDLRQVTTWAKEGV